LTILRTSAFDGSRFEAASSASYAREERLERRTQDDRAREGRRRADTADVRPLHQLSVHLSRSHRDASRAYDALDAASNLEPSNAEVRKIVIELLIVTDQLDNAVGRVREEI